MTALNPETRQKIRKILNFLTVLLVSFVLTWLLLKRFSIPQKEVKAKPVKVIAEKPSLSLALLEIPKPPGLRPLPILPGKFKSGGIYESSLPRAEVAKFYRSFLLSQGWTEDKKYGLKLAKAAKMQTIVFTKVAFRCIIDLDKLKYSKGTAVVIRVLREQKHPVLP